MDIATINTEQECSGHSKIPRNVMVPASQALLLAEGTSKVENPEQDGDRGCSGRQKQGNNKAG